MKKENQLKCNMNCHLNYSTCISLIMFFFLTIISCFSQELKNKLDANIIPPSPSVSELNKYIGIPVDLYSGIPQISFPLLDNLSSGKISSSISLSYHASGINVEQQASWVGLGWSLNSGGYISRNVIGLPDDIKDLGPAYPFFVACPNIDEMPDKGYLYSYHYLKEKYYDTYTVPYVPTLAWGDCADPQVKQDYLLYLMSIGYIETEPDIFNYSIGNYKGKFLFYFSNDSLRIMQIPENNIRIYPYFVKQNGETTDVFDHTQEMTIGGFELIDPNGNRYLFNDKERTTFDSYVRFPYSYNSAWMLNSIISPDNVDSIIYHYQPNEILEKQDDRYSVSKEVPLDGLSCLLCLGSGCNENRIIKTAITLNYYTKKLARIETKNSIVSFYNSGRIDLSNLTGVKLDSIVLSYKNSALKKTISFSYSYFNWDDNISIAARDGGMVNITKRLKLSSFTTKDNSRKNNLVYSFKYYEYSDDVNELRLPRRDSPSYDLWGYYNGYNEDYYNCTNFCDDYFLPRTPNGIGGLANINTNPDIRYQRVGTLSEISLPTGGKTKLEYEIHKVNNENISGIRIKKIANIDGNQSLIREYSYENGKLFNGKPQVFDTIAGSIWRQIPNYGPCLCDCEEVFDCPEFSNYKHLAVYSKPFSLLSGPNGLNVAYNKITEYHGTASANIGYAQTFFSFPTYINAASQWYPYAQTLNYTWEYALPDSTLVYSNSLTGTNLKKRIRNTYINQTVLNKEFYKFFCRNSPLWIGLCMRNLPKCEGECLVAPTNATLFMSYAQAAKYFFETGWRKLSQQIEIQDGVTKTTNYFYDSPDHSFVNRVITEQSNGEKLVLKYRYPMDYSTGWRNFVISTPKSELMKMLSDFRSNTDQSIFDEMSALNMISAPIEVKQLITHVNGETLLLSGELTKYIRVDTMIYPYQKYATENKDPIIDFEVNMVGENMNYLTPPYSLRNTYRFNNLGRLEESKKENDISIAYIWGYNKLYPVAKITGSDFNTANGILSTSDKVILAGNCNDSQVRVIIDKIRNDTAMKTALVSTYTYNAIGKLTSETKENGIITYYDYDESGRLINVKDPNGNILKHYEYHYKE